MLKFYDYHKTSEDFDNIVELVKEVSDASYEGKSDTAKNALINEAIVKYCVTATPYEAAFATKGMELFKNPQVTADKVVRSRFNAVIAEIINAVPMAAVSPKYESWIAEFSQIGLGDTARFLLDSNELFFVEELAQGVNRGTVQPLYNDEVTVNPIQVDITTGVKWYEVATGKMDWGKFAMKVARSYDAYIFNVIYRTMTAAVASLGSYTAAGITNSNWTTIKSRVATANGGAEVYAIGTLAALSNVYPSVVGLQYGLGEEIAKNGYLNIYLNTPLIPVDQAMLPGTINNAATLVLNDSVIYFIAAGASKPVKVVFGGDAYVLETDGYSAADTEYKLSVKMHIGCKAIIGPKVGAITL